MFRVEEGYICAELKVHLPAVMMNMNNVWPAGGWVCYAKSCKGDCSNMKLNVGSVRGCVLQEI